MNSPVNLYIDQDISYIIIIPHGGQILVPIAPSSKSINIIFSPSY